MQQLTPMRSPKPRGRRGRGGSGRHNSLPAKAATAMTTMSSKSPKAASSSEKETPTVVLTAMTKNISPYNLSNTNCDNPSSSKSNKHDDNVEGGRIAVMKRERERDRATQQSTRSTRKFSRHDLSDEESSGGEDNDMKKKCRDDEFSEEESSGGEKDDYIIYEDDNVVNAIQHLLQCGVASICRLRKLFPLSFFETFDLDGTSVTQFQVEYIEQALRRSVNGESNDEDYDYDGDDDLEERSVMKSISTKRSATQKSVSPLTGASQWLSQYQYRASQRGTSTAPPDFGSDDEALKMWQKQAMEALTLVQWMKNTDKIFREGKLATLVFSICDGDELIESYSFQLSFAEHSQFGELQMTKFKDSMGLFFRNLNGYSAGSRALLPARTQSSLPSQGFTQASSQYFTQQNFALSQKHNAASQWSSIVMSMTQQSVRSIRVSTKKNSGNQIPDSRYLSLDVKFTDKMEVDDLPDVFQKQEDDTTSPFPAEDGMNHLVVTPLGTISESCLAGLKVDMHAYSKNKGRKEDEDEDDERSVYFSQHSHSPDQAFDAERSISSNSDEPGSEDSDSLAYAIPCKKSDMDVYLPCKFLGYRQSTKTNGDEKEEFKMEFDNEELATKGLKKQWLLSKNVISSTEMHAGIKRELKERCADGIGEGVSITSFDVAKIAEELKVQGEVVRSVAERAGMKVRDEKNVRGKKQRRVHES